MLRTLKALTRKDLLALLLGWISVIAVFIAQTSSNTCTSWLIEQPKIPKSLIKED
ncbi:MAG TPA: cyclic lactone autoinducer peptide [Acetivibrio sp.]|uniref:cyclic lactone autoinducer peptide n=1 Tax=Acetivibrio sp. TaxID=1872092 RepID=UPI002C8E6862|nr:cyclic lactone autoinducer peptide [Acetivibrio sp.]HOM02449.1 cyclic lactone autoinducer peptide [Acetivibrio sp.]